MSEQALQYKNFLYEETDEGIKITGYTGCAEHVAVPEAVNGTPVTRIVKNAISPLHVKTLDIPKTVACIEYSNAFGYGFDGIRLNILPGNKCYRSDGVAVYQIHDDGSESIFCIANKAITQFTVPETVKRLEARAFDGCARLKKLVLNDGLEFFDERCLKSPLRNVKMERLRIPATVKEIRLAGGLGVLGGVLRYTIHEDNPYYFMDDDICYEVGQDGRYTVLFCQNQKISHAVINEGTVAIGAFAFAALDADVDFDEEFHASFSGDDDEDEEDVKRFERLTKVELPDSLETIGAYAFANCSALTQIALGPSVREVDQHAFAGCSRLEKITVDGNNGRLTAIDGVLFDREVKRLVLYPEARKADRYEMPDSVEDFGTAFEFVRCVKELYLSANVRRIGDNAFPVSCAIRALHMRNDIKDVAAYAFGPDWGLDRDEQIEIYADPNGSFARYVEQTMKSPRQYVRLVDGSDTPEMRELRKRFVFKEVDDGLCITHGFAPGYRSENKVTFVIPGRFGDRPVVELGDGMFHDDWEGIGTVVISEGIKRVGKGVLSTDIPTVFPASVEEISPQVVASDDEYPSCNVTVEPESYAETFFSAERFRHARVTVNGDEADYMKMILTDEGYTAELREGTKPTDRMIVPNTYRGKPVKKVILMEGYSWYSLPEKILALSIPENVEEIVGLANYKPDKKTKDKLPSISVAEGNKRFWSDGVALYTKDRKTLVQLVDHSVKKYAVCAETEVIAEEAFTGCSAIRKVTLSENTRSLERNAFCHCTSLAEIIGMEHVQSVGSDAFRNTPYKNNQECIIVGKTLVKYSGPQQVFQVPDGVETIGEYAFNGADKLEEVILPSSVKALARCAFYGREALKTICLPEGLLTIGRNAFDSCDALERIHIPSTVTKIDPDAFPTEDWSKKKSKLAELTVSEDNPRYRAVDNVLYDKAMTQLLYIPADAQMEELTIPATVKKIRRAGSCNKLKKVTFLGPIDEMEGKGTFSGCKNLACVTFAADQKRIWNGAFKNCRRLKKIQLPASLREIGNEAFYGTGLDEISLPDTVEHIGNEAFGETHIKKVSLPKSVRTLGWGAFSGVPEIEVYDTIDPDAKDARKCIDTDNGYPNSLVGYIGMGPANAMWECAANHKWVNYTITVRSAETDAIKYKVWMGADSSQRQYYCFLSSAWGRNATFAFQELDAFFPKIRGADHKLRVAQYRLEYPWELSDEAREKYEAYIKKNAGKGE